MITPNNPSDHSKTFEMVDQPVDESSTPPAQNEVGITPIQEPNIRPGDIVRLGRVSFFGPSLDGDFDA